MITPPSNTEVVDLQDALSPIVNDASFSTHRQPEDKTKNKITPLCDANESDVDREADRLELLRYLRLPSDPEDTADPLLDSSDPAFRIMRRGIDPNGGDRHASMLTLAIQKGDIHILKELVRLGADTRWNRGVIGDGLRKIVSHSPVMAKLLDGMGMLDGQPEPLQNAIRAMTSILAARGFEYCHHAADRRYHDGELERWGGEILDVINDNPDAGSHILANAPKNLGFVGQYAWSKPITLSLLVLASIIRNEALSIWASRHIFPRGETDLYDLLWIDIIKRDDLDSLRYCVEQGWVPNPVPSLIAPSSHPQHFSGWAWRSLLATPRDSQADCFRWLMKSPALSNQFFQQAKISPFSPVLLLGGRGFSRNWWDWLHGFGVDFSAVSATGETLAHTLLRQAKTPAKAKAIVRWLVKTGHQWQLSTQDQAGRTPIEALSIGATGNERALRDIPAILAKAERYSLSLPPPYSPDSTGNIPHRKRI